MIRRYSILGLIAAAALISALLVACGGGSSTSNRSTAPATINVSLSDPAPCSAASNTGGIYQSIFIAISDVQINASPTAGDNDPNWLDLTPTLSTASAPIQVNLLDLPNPQCFLSMLGSTTAIPPGTYQQIRIRLADNNATNATALGSKNGCAPLTTVVNCVFLPGNPTPQPLQLSSEARTGIKIPSGQIAGGQFTIAAGETKDLNIDIDGCGSVVRVVAQGNGQFRLKPVLHAGEVSLTSSSINGKLVDPAGNAITGIKAIVVLERNDGTGTDKYQMEATTDSTGAFNFCPVPDGTYDVVAVAMGPNNAAFAATITTGVKPGTAMGNITMNAVSGASTAPAILNGDVSTANATVGGVAASVTVSALQQVTVPVGSTTANITFIIPVGLQTARTTVETAKPASCTSATCPSFSATYSPLTLPPVNPTTGGFAAGGTHYSAGATGNPSYIVNADAFVVGSTQTDCSPSTLTSAGISVSPGSTTTVPTLTFVGCLQ